MDQDRVRRRRSIMGPVILICIGLFFLLANLVPGFRPWWILSRYWPVILILVGLGRVWDYYAGHRTGDTTPRQSETGIIVALVLLLLLLFAGFFHRWDRTEGPEKHQTRTVELQGATTVSADVQMPAGSLDINGGNSKLLDADFRYDGADNDPRVDYSVDGGRGQLDVAQRQRRAQFGSHDDDTWKLQFDKNVPLDLNLSMGAGQSDLRAGELNLTRLNINIGAGQMALDLTGPRKQNLSADVHGGAGQATIRLPKDVGVRVHASGGIGAIDAEGLTKQGDEYVNAVYGKTPTSIDLTINGGVGEIDLRQEP